MIAVPSCGSPGGWFFPRIRGGQRASVKALQGEVLVLAAEEGLRCPVKPRKAAAPRTFDALRSPCYRRHQPVAAYPPASAAVNGRAFQALQGEVLVPLPGHR